MGKVRLHDLMRRFGVGIDTLVAFLNDRDACLSDVTPNTKVSDKYVESLDAFLSHEKSVEPPHDAPVKAGMTRQEEHDVEMRREEIRSMTRLRRKIKGWALDASNVLCRECDHDEKPVVLQFPWSRIELQDGKIILDYCKDIRIPVICPKSRGSYVASIRMFRQNPQPVEVAVHSKGYFIRNPEIIDGMMELLSLYDRICSLIIRHEPVRVNIGRVNRIPSDLFWCMFPLGDSAYLNHLLKLQDGGFNYIPLHESHVGCPDGYLFTIRTAEGYRIVWECVQLSERRSTYVFYADEDEVPCLLQFLSDFITSGKPGMRNGLRRKADKEFYGFRYASIKHDDMQAWKERLAALLSLRPQTRQHQEDSGILYPAFIRWLEKNGYTDVAPGRDDREVVAVALDGTRHVFEVKESSRESRIRESLGWILGHAHYHCSSDPERLTIVGTHRISEEQKKSLMLLRKLYGLHVRYAFFDISSSVLHESSDSWE